MDNIDTMKVEEILTSLSQIPEDKRPVTPEGTLDILKLNEMEEVKNVVELLKKEGVKSPSHLDELGFMMGAMILKF